MARSRILTGYASNLRYFATIRLASLFALVEQTGYDLVAMPEESSEDLIEVLERVLKQNTDLRDRLKEALQRIDSLEQNLEKTRGETEMERQRGELLE